MKAAIFGDIGGHAELFEDALIEIGCDPSRGYVPEELYVIQVGDLIDRGPDSDGVFDIAMKMMESDQYVQLLGNHEGPYFGGPRFMTPGNTKELSPDRGAIMKTWRKEGKAFIAAGLITSEGEEYLVTHAGLNPTFWALNTARQRYLDKLVPALNNMGHKVFDAGLMLRDHRDIPGPCWAMTWDEVIAAWIQFNADMPWHQVHGHAALYMWGSRKIHVHPLFIDQLEVWPKVRISRFPVDGKYVYQVDPKLGKYSDWVPKPLMIDNVTELYL